LSCTVKNTFTVSLLKLIAKCSSKPKLVVLRTHFNAKFVFIIVHFKEQSLNDKFVYFLTTVDHIFYFDSTPVSSPQFIESYVIAKKN